VFIKRVIHLFSLTNLKTLSRHFLQVLGAVWLMLEVAYFFSLIERGRPGLLLGIIGVALFWAIARSFPPLAFRKKSKPSNVEIEIGVGNILEEPSNIAFGCSDCFDSEPEMVIGKDSLMAQLVRTSFGGKHKLLDQEIGAALNSEGIVGLHDPRKTFGKLDRYPIGTVAKIDVNRRKAFLLVFSVTNYDKTTTTSKEDLWISFGKLWAAVRKHGYSEPIAVPVLGSGLARFRSSRISLIQLILLSFAIATREDIVCRRLKIVISPDSYDPDEIAEAIQMIETLDF
jgi:hypothetical protein